MRRLKLYALLALAFFLSLFVPTTAMARRVERVLAELKGLDTGPDAPGPRGV